MKATDLVHEIEIINMESRFGKLLKINVGDGYIACDLFAVRFPKLFPNITGKEIGNVIINLKKLCDTLENYIKETEK